MSTSAASETKDRYTVLCQQRNVKPNDYVIKALSKSAQDYLLSSSDELRLELSGNNKLMTSTRLSDEDVEILCTIISRSTALFSLDLRYNNFSDEGAKFVGKLIKDSPSLTELNVMCNDITESGAEHIADALQSSTTLRSLKMNGNKIGNRGGMFFAQALQINNKLRELDLGDCDLGTECVIGMATVLNQNRHLRALNLNRPLLFSKQEETVVHLGRMLKVNSTLRELHLAKYDMRDFGVERLCDGLRDNYTLVYLNLSCNRISRDGAGVLAKLLRRNTPLEILDLSFNRIEEDGAKHLSAALATSNSNLKALVLVSNCIGGDGIVAVASAMNTNASLSNVYIWGNDLHEAACDAFGQLMRSKRLQQRNTDVQPYIVDGRTYLSELSHGIRRFYYWTPSYGPDVVGMDDDL
ncbi:leucine-rich repeat-containing protein 34-like [Clavelina lepadiformis]|uniref:Leucine-rich repeat-containing protein 34 n=1 Tax=Clavelina lepadiformis TaxID=159417 RepID=A0ABP0GYW5_CLALP